MSAPTTAIIGAGTAGLACAIALAQRGVVVDVFERHHSLEPVGAGMLIQPGGLHGLHRLGALEQFEAVSVPIHRLEGRSHKNWLLVDVQYCEKLAARAVTRPALTRVLQQRAQSLGVRLHFDARVSELRQVADRVELSVSGRTECFSAAVIASGSGSPLAQACGLCAPATMYPWGALNGLVVVDDWAWPNILQQRFEGPRKLYGLMPSAVEQGKVVLSLFWSLPVDRLPTWQAANLDDWKDELLALWPASAPAVDQIREHSQLTFATYRHAWPRRLATGRICLVGDAAHAMSPQLGLGTTLARGDAMALAEGVAHLGVEGGMKAYERSRALRVKVFQVLSRALTPCFQANLPAWWRDVAFGAGVRVPGVKQLMRASLGG